MNDDRIYDPTFVRKLFDEMSATYGVVNYVSSFGFCERWRRACVNAAVIEPGMTVYDLMTGMGECWHLIDRRLHGLDVRYKRLFFGCATLLCGQKPLLPHRSNSIT